MIFFSPSKSVKRPSYLSGLFLFWQQVWKIPGLAPASVLLYFKKKQKNCNLGLGEVENSLLSFLLHSTWNVSPDYSKVTPAPRFCHHLSLPTISFSSARPSLSLQSLSLSFFLLFYSAACLQHWVCFLFIFIYSSSSLSALFALSAPHCFPANCDGGPLLEFFFFCAAAAPTKTAWKNWILFKPCVCIENRESVTHQLTLY